MIANRSAARKRDLFEIECKSKTTSSCFSPILPGLVRNIQLAMHFLLCISRYYAAARQNMGEGVASICAPVLVPLRPELKKLAPS